VSKETYSYGKRGLFIWQKRPIAISIPQHRQSASPTPYPTLNSDILH